MKLYEFLKQFEGLDPELEVYQNSQKCLKMAFKTKLNPKIAFVTSTNCLVICYSDERDNVHDKKAIVLF